MTADEIHALGLAEVARIHAEMEAIKRQVGFDGTLREFFASLRNDPQFLFPNNDEGREGYLQASRDFYGADRSAVARVLRAAAEGAVSS